jgi:hypothetical protein
MAIIGLSMAIMLLPPIEGDDRERVVIRALSPLSLRQGEVAIGDLAETFEDEAEQLARLGAAELTGIVPPAVPAVPAGDGEGEASGGASPTADAAADEAATEAADAASEVADGKPKARRR